jgi:ubiquinone/menaquinone biosynthesis C-methylase UbiE
MAELVGEVLSRDVVRDPLPETLASLLNFAAVETLIEVGCGSGKLTAWLAEQVAGGGRVVGIDTDSAALERARGRARAAMLTNAVFATGSAYCLPLPDASADIVLCNSLLCVLTQVDDAVEEMCRVARPGGLLVAIEPASTQLFHDPDDLRYAELSRKLNLAFHRGWTGRGVDQSVGLRVAGIFLRHRLGDLVAEGAIRVHLLADRRRSFEDVVEQLETESYQLREPTLGMVLKGDISLTELQEQNRKARERLARFISDPPAARRSGYVRLSSTLMVTIGTKPY